MMVSPLATWTSSIASITASSRSGASFLKTADDTTVERIRCLVASAFKRAPPPPNDLCSDFVTGLKIDAAAWSTDGVACFPPVDLAAAAVLPIVAPGESLVNRCCSPSSASASTSAFLPPTNDSTIVGTSRSLRLLSFRIEGPQHHIITGSCAPCCGD
jgi:hypothetical protein